MLVIQLLDKFCYGGGERVALTYNRTIQELGLKGMILAIKDKRTSLENITHLVNNYRSYFMFIIAAINANKSGDVWLFAHSSRALMVANVIKLLYLSRVKVCFVQHLAYPSKKLRLYSYFQPLLEKFIQITPITKIQQSKYFNSNKLFYLNNYIHPDTYVELAGESNTLIDLQNFKGSRQLISFVGAVKRGKNALHLIELAALLPEQNFCFAVIGDGEELEQLKALVRQRDLAHVLFLGYQEQPLQFLKESSYLFFPSYESEMMPMAVLEAKENNCIVIAYDLDINKHLLPISNIFPYKRFEQIAQSIIQNDLEYSSNEFDVCYGREKFTELLGLR